jgi:hypothetical protein
VGKFPTLQAIQKVRSEPATRSAPVPRTKRAAEAAPSISAHGLSLSPPSNQQLACKGHYVLPILRCPLLADADIFN